MLLRVAMRFARGGAGAAKPTSVVAAIQSDNDFGSAGLLAEVRALTQSVLWGHKTTTKGITATVSTWYEKPMPKPANYFFEIYDISDQEGKMGVTMNGPTPADFLPSHAGLLVRHAAKGGRAGFSHLRGALQEVDVVTGPSGVPALTLGVGDVNAHWTEFHTQFPNLLVVANVRKGQTVPTVRDVQKSVVVGVFQRKDTRHKKPKEKIEAGKSTDSDIIGNLVQIASDLAPMVSWALAEKVGMTVARRIPLVAAVTGASALLDATLNQLQAPEAGQGQA